MEKFEWVSHPLKESMSLNIIAFLGILLMLLVGYVSLGYVGMIVSVLVIILSLISYFAPTKYRIENGKINVSFMFIKKDYELSHFKSYYIDNKGILLSPFKKPNRLENFRGLYVRFGLQKESVVRLIAENISKEL